MSKVIGNIGKLTKKFAKLADGVKVGIRREVDKTYLSDLQKVVAPFETEIPFHVVESTERGSLVFLVEPIPGISFQRQNSAGDGAGTLTTAELFLYLNDGTEVRHAVMPGDFQNESAPNSLNTSSQNYDRSGIFASGKINRDGVEARNWLRLTREQQEGTIGDSVRKTIRRLVK